MLQNCAQPDDAGAAALAADGLVGRLDVLLDQIADGRDGLTAARAAGLSWREVAARRRADAGFDAAFRAAAAAAEDLLETMLLSRAIHGTPVTRLAGGAGGVVETIEHSEKLALTVAERADRRRAAEAPATPPGPPPAPPPDTPPGDAAAPPVTDAEAVRALQELILALDPEAGRRDPSLPQEIAPDDLHLPGPAP